MRTRTGHTDGGMRRALRDARDESHYQLLRVSEAVRERWPEDGLEEWIEDYGAHARRAIVLVVAAVALVIVWPYLNKAWAMIVPAGGAPERVARATPRADTIVGTSKADELGGRSGADLIVGGRGDDVLTGGPGDDVLHGGSGDDQLYASGGRDVLVGGPGDDHLFAQALDGPDRLVCGPGKDVAYVARVNGVIRDRTVGCEKVVVKDFVVRKARGGR